MYKRILFFVFSFLVFFSSYSYAEQGQGQSLNENQNFQIIIDNIKRDFFNEDTIESGDNASSFYGLTFNIIIPAMGVFIFLLGIRNFYVDSQGGQNRKGKAFLTLLSGILLLNFPFFVSLVSNSIFGGNNDITCFMSPSSCLEGGEDVLKKGVKLAFMMIVFSGGIAVARGILIIRNIQSAEQSGTFTWKNAIMFILGGTLMINIKTFLIIFSGWFGTNTWMTNILELLN